MRTRKAKTNRQTIQMLEIELIIILAIALVLGLLFGFSLAKERDGSPDPMQTEQTLRSGLGGTSGDLD